MEVRFILSREDLWNYVKYALSRSYRRSLLPGLVLLIGAAVVILFPLILSDQSFSLLSLLPVLIVLIVPVLIVLRLRRFSSRGAGRGGEHTISINPEGLRHRTDVSDSTSSWRAIKAIEQDRHNFYFVQDTLNSRVFMAVIIPRHAFAASQDAETFLELAREYWTNRQATLSATTEGIPPLDYGQQTPTNGE